MNIATQPDTPHEYYQITLSRFQSSNPDGTGKRKILEQHRMQTPSINNKRQDLSMRLLYREVKKKIEELQRRQPI